MAQNRIWKGTVLIAVLMILAFLDDSLAYFTDTESLSNVFTVGNIEILLTDSLWEGTETILPLQEIESDSEIRNVGTNDAYVFVQIEVPCAELITAARDGTKGVEKDTELFGWKMQDGWSQIGEVMKDEDEKLHTYTYAYGGVDEITVLSVKDSVQILESITFANIIEGQGVEGQKLEMDIHVYAIQAENIVQPKTDGIPEEAAVLSPEEVWKVLHTQTVSSKTMNER